MGAARYVGRVGGLAIALGVGTAILTGQAVASADDTGTSGSGSASPSSESRTSSTPSNTGTGTVKINKRPLGKHQANDGTSLGDTVKGIVDRVAGERGKRATDDSENADPGVDEQAPAEEAAAARPGDRRKHRVDANEQAPQQNPQTDPTPAAAQDQPAVKQSPGLTWLKSPRVAAAREAKPVATTSSSLWTPPGALVTEDAATAPAATTTVAPVKTAVAEFLTSIHDALAPNGGTAPVGGSLSDLLLLAGTRRELVQPQAAALPDYSVGLTEGVIGGCVVGATCTMPDGSTYTVIGTPSKGGKLALDATTGAFTFLPFSPEYNADGSQNADGPSGQESFTVLVAQNTKFDTFVTGLPIVGTTFIAPVIMTLQQLQILTPLIGTAARQDVTVNVDELRGVLDTPVAYTTMVTSWDGTQISTNFFPAITTGNPDVGSPGYETIFNGPGLAQPGATSPADPFVATFRQAGYNVVTWDPRGEFASGGVLQLDSPQYEGQDVSQLISWAAGLNGVQLDAPNDPTMGMVGVSYGGGIQLVTAAGDNRVDAIAPGWAWNTLPDSLYPDKAFKTAYSSLLLLGLVTTGARINPMIYGGILTGATLGILTPGQIQLLQNSGPGQTVRGISAPTLIIQGTVDVLFPLQQSILNAALLAQNPDVKLLWFCGGHGSCLPGQGNPAADDVWVMGETLAWMDRYVKNDGTTDPNVFEWTDQNGDRWTSETLPTAADFYDTTSKVPATTWDTGKVLPIIPILGGSGPNPQVPLPYSLGDGSIATNAVTIPLDNPDSEANVVGAPHVVINYSGLGTSRHVYAQVVDKTTGQVVGNIVTPIPVTLNGRDQTATIDLNDIAYTVTPDSDLELQIFTTATPYLNLTQFGFIDVQSVQVSLPTTSQGTNQGPNPVPAAAQELVAV
ncbi:X-Pro dipeptidyl-peptidase (S15 family) [Mycolicibacterium chubuense NBB4]|uniref:X-Pro dipeptidyl-peptidase (S15 family) n=1 Tax=Mycolicibacterium chubuense (strain NBB4) TaxID=710421 RepID=I4BLT9_MYCCN|nr:CocE/NonD family hydrolase [Mycolicibacterium chubuense]AFM18246.1 X-Pro dipeptidyl-peptidase (S15 family) [Mycolicibacterium chubuense NBB4]